MAKATTEAAAPVAQSEEQRIAEQRDRDLRQQASDASAASNAAKADAAALKGELERAQAQVAGLRAANEQLTKQLEQLQQSVQLRETLPSLPDLPRGAAQLTESVTIGSLDDDNKPLRTAARRGDVVVVGGDVQELESLRGKVGTVATVHRIDKATREELEKLRFLR
jgi:hypothetical protein